MLWRGFTRELRLRIILVPECADDLLPVKDEEWLLPRLAAQLEDQGVRRLAVHPDMAAVNLPVMDEACR